MPLLKVKLLPTALHRGWAFKPALLNYQLVKQDDETNQEHENRQPVGAMHQPQVRF